MEQGDEGYLICYYPLWDRIVDTVCEVVWWFECLLWDWRNYRKQGGA